MTNTQVLAGLPCCRLFFLTSGLHGPRVRLIMPKTFEDFEVMSVTCFVQVNLESNFTPRYEWLDTVDSGWPKSEYL